jgi:hypothetical protein
MQAEASRLQAVRDGAERAAISRQARAKEEFSMLEATKARARAIALGHSKEMLRQRRDFAAQYDAKVAALCEENAKVRVDPHECTFFFPTCFSFEYKGGVVNAGSH